MVISLNSYIIRLAIKQFSISTSSIPSIHRTPFLSLLLSHRRLLLALNFQVTVLFVSCLQFKKKKKKKKVFSPFLAFFPSAPPFFFTIAYPSPPPPHNPRTSRTYFRS